MNRLKLFIAALMCAASFVWADDYNLYSVKAQRAFQQQEWASASAMYGILLDMQPSNSDVYGHAITTAAMRHDTLSQLQLMNQAIAHHVPFDSTFAAVKQVSLALANDTIYENFMLLVQRNNDWLNRAINPYLLDYYVFRNNAPAIIHYSRLMLEGLPNSVKYLTTLADALMFDGQTTEAIETYNRIVQLNPDNYHALIALGNHYALIATDAEMQPDITSEARQQALKHLKQAYALRATPNVSRLIKQLSENTTH